MKLKIHHCLLILLFFLFLVCIFLCMMPVREGYRDTNTSYSVDLPLTTSTTCLNFCGPNSKCAYTGTQCTSDPDCSGCEPPIPPQNKNTPSVSGYDDAGKLTDEMSSTFSVLTTDIGTQAFQIKDAKSVTPGYNQGTNTWINAFNDGQQLYEKRYNPQFEVIQSLPNYTSTPSLTGEFVTTGPLAANADLSGV
jgi:hypothetical protein